MVRMNEWFSAKIENKTELSILIISTQHTGDSSWVDLKQRKTPTKIGKKTSLFTRDIIAYKILWNLQKTILELVSKVSHISSLEINIW